MSRLYLNTTGLPTLGIGICARCHRKFPLGELLDDPNAEGLKVCARDQDVLDPYRLPPREADDTQLDFVRPDEPLA